MRTLDLALIGNGRIGLLVEASGRIVWGCFPRFDGDPMFCALLDDAPDDRARGQFAIELSDFAHAEQAYLPNTAVLVTTLADRHGGRVEITDCVPRFRRFGRLFQPLTLVRQVRRLSGSPRVTVRLRPSTGYGSERPAMTMGSSHLRFVGASHTLRLTTDASLTAIADERPFHVDGTLTFVLGPDESVPETPGETGRHFIDETVAYWREWVRRLAIPFEWQSAVIRAAITLQLNQFDDTGAIIAAMTTSVPESAGSERNWDYRYCWLRDAYFVVDALNRLNATDTMEGYLRYVVDAALPGDDQEPPPQPVYRINGEAALNESIAAALPGFRGMGPVRVGNDAYRQVQHDVYGSAVLAATHVFFDERLAKHGDVALFQRLEALGRRAIAVHDQPDAGLWELRGTTRVHTFSAVMCWAACDRLARIAKRLGLAGRTATWREEAARVARFVQERCWSDARQAYVATADGSELDASLLLLADLGFVEGSDPRFDSTVRAVERELRRGEFMFRYVERDDFGLPENAFVVCTFWHVNALVHAGRREEARMVFERLLAARNRHGLFAEHIDPATGEHWGNFVQTYSMVGLISSAIRLSMPWDEAF
jgi:GH15 family glucan-1,4-alpha-glucosidase